MYNMKTQNESVSGSSFTLVNTTALCIDLAKSVSSKVKPQALTEAVVYTNQSTQLLIHVSSN